MAQAELSTVFHVYYVAQIRTCMLDMASTSKKRSIKETDIDIEQGDDIATKKQKLTTTTEDQNEENKTNTEDDLTDDSGFHEFHHGKNVRAIISAVVWKPNWKKKVTSTKILAKWKKEVLAQGCNECDFIVAIKLLTTMAMGNPIKVGYVSRLAFTQYYNRPRGNDEDLPLEERKKLDQMDYESHWDDTKYAGNMELLFKHAIMRKNYFIDSATANEFQANMK
eukprot:730563_1